MSGSRDHLATRFLFAASILCLGCHASLVAVTGFTSDGIGRFVILVAFCVAAWWGSSMARFALIIGSAGATLGSLGAALLGQQMPFHGIPTDRPALQALVWAATCVLYLASLEVEEETRPGRV